MLRRDVRRFTAAFPELAAALGSAGTRRFLHSCRGVRFPPGAVLVRGGERGGGLVLVTRGEVRTTADVAMTAELWTAGSGSVAGASEFLEPGPAELTVSATTACTALVLHRDEFLAVAASEPRVAQALLDHLAMELLRTRDRLKILFSTLRMENLA